MRISALILMVLTIGLFSSGFLAFYGALMNSNGLTPQDFSGMNNTSSTIQSLSQMYDITAASQQNSASSTGTIIGFAPWNLIVGAYNAGMFALQTPVFFYEMIRNLTTNVTGLPTYVFDYLSAIILCVVIGAVLYFITGKYW